MWLVKTVGNNGQCSCAHITSKTHTSKSNMYLDTNNILAHRTGPLTHKRNTHAHAPCGHKRCAACSQLNSPSLEEQASCHLQHKQASSTHNTNTCCSCDCQHCSHTCCDNDTTAITLVQNSSWKFKHAVIACVQSTQPPGTTATSRASPHLKPPLWVPLAWVADQSEPLHQPWSAREEG